jgi:hypothetical protein
MERPEYMRFHTRQIPDKIMAAYKLLPLIHNKYVYVKITKGMYGLPQAGKIANHPAKEIHYGHSAQLDEPIDSTPLFAKADITNVQKIVSTFLYYAPAVDGTMNVVLSALSSEQSNATENMSRKVHHFLDYWITYPNAITRFHISDMRLKIHSDASYCSVPKSRSLAGGHFYNEKEGIILRNTLQELSWPQPHSTADGIANNTIKQQCSRAIDM